jgi:ATP-binding cassette subfamily F protein 3
MIVGEIDYGGSIQLGHQIKMGYYAQNQADFLDEDITVLETIENAVTEQTSSNVRTILGSFLFSNDDVTKKIKVLSGGERARVALCKLLLEPYNLLVMDEPTNHLDITSKDLLKKALLNFDGSLIVVSHDREFLQGLTQKVYEFKNQNIKEYIGDINTFLSEKEMSNFKQLESSQKDQKIVDKDKNKEQKSYHDKKNHKSNIKKLRNRINKLEKEITTLSTSLKEKDEALSDPVKFKELSNDKDFFSIYDQEQQNLKKLEDDWAIDNEKLDQLIS